MSELPKGWVEISLEKVATWGSGGTPKRSEPYYYGGDVPWVKTGDLGPRYLKEASEYISQLGLAKSSAKVFPKGSVAIAMYGATIGKTSILDFEASTNQACAVGNPIDGVILTDFLYYFLTSEKQNFIKKGKGGAQPNISQQLIKAHKIKLAPLAEQKRIVAKLDEVLAQVDTIKARLDRIPAILKRFRQSVLAAAVSGKLTEEWRGSSILVGWQTKKLGSIVQAIEAGKNLKCIETPPENDEYGIIKISAVTWGVYDEGQSKTLPSKDLFIESRRVNVGDFLISRANTIELLGNPVIVHRVTKNLMLSDKVLRLVMREEDKSWVSIFLRSTDGRKEIESRSTGNQMSMRNIGQKALLDIDMPKAPDREQTEIVRLVDQYFAFADTIEAQVKKAQARVDNLTQSILAKAFRGELVAQDPNDEPADKLLERIAKARSEAEQLAKAAIKAVKAGRKTRIN
ncbi:restriction endonuclease subunit S [Vibrio metschnikovii]|uniref:restriction endonuclease subunit S n=1 Tax=Vibrio metschnikovii TaxID=28172 RepID=UPI002FC8356A